MPIEIASRRRSLEKLAATYPEARIIDVTSKATDDFVQLSPFYPHGGIPVPFSEGRVAQSVEGIWQGLKVFEQHDVDPARFEIIAMRGIKRTVRKYGRTLGHRKGVEGTELLDYRAARLEIFLPAYAWVLAHKTEALIQQIAAWANSQPVILLDYETNGSIDNLQKSLSHAALLKHYIEGGFSFARSSE